VGDGVERVFVGDAVAASRRVDIHTRLLYYEIAELVRTPMLAPGAGPPRWATVS
jgi:hypothetical protein